MFGFLGGPSSTGKGKDWPTSQGREEGRKGQLKGKMRQSPRVMDSWTRSGPCVDVGVDVNVGVGVGYGKDSTWAA